MPLQLDEKFRDANQSMFMMMMIFSEICFILYKIQPIKAYTPPPSFVFLSSLHKFCAVFLSWHNLFISQIDMVLRFCSWKRVLTIKILLEQIASLLVIFIYS